MGCAGRLALLCHCSCRCHCACQSFNSTSCGRHSAVKGGFASAEQQHLPPSRCLLAHLHGSQCRCGRMRRRCSYCRRAARASRAAWSRPAGWRRCPAGGRCRRCARAASSSPTTACSAARVPGEAAPLGLSCWSILSWDASNCELLRCHACAGCMSGQSHNVVCPALQPDGLHVSILPQM